MLHDFPLDSNPGWTVESQWGWGKPWGQGSHNLDPLSGHTGAFVYGYNLFGDYGLNLSEFHLTSGPLDVTNHTRAELRFWRWLGIEDSAFDHARVSVSNDGSTWIDVWIHDGPAIEDLDWVEQVLDISAVADNQPTVYVRWTMGTTDGATTYPGWNIDDIRILGVPPTPPLFGDVNGDCVVNVTDLAIVLGEFGRSDAGVTADVDGDGDLADLAGVLGAFGTFCP
ncbi:MAG: hypothetical protein ACE5EX_08010 [Phycisphaerae bacterium]